MNQNDTFEFCAIPVFTSTSKLQTTNEKMIVFSICKRLQWLANMIWIRLSWILLVLRSRQYASLTTARSYHHFKIDTLSARQMYTTPSLLTMLVKQSSFSRRSSSSFLSCSCTLWNYLFFGAQVSTLQQDYSTQWCSHLSEIFKSISDYPW